MMDNTLACGCCFAPRYGFLLRMRCSKFRIHKPAIILLNVALLYNMRCQEMGANLHLGGLLQPPQLHLFASRHVIFCDVFSSHHHRNPTFIWGLVCMLRNSKSKSDLEQKRTLTHTPFKDHACCNSSIVLIIIPTQCRLSGSYIGSVHSITLSQKMPFMAKIGWFTLGPDKFC